MKRSVIQLAKNTLVVSLPSVWCRNNKITKGDELLIEEGPSCLTVAKEIIHDKRTIDVDISSMTSVAIWHLMRTLFNQGFSEIILRFSNNVVFNPKVEENISVHTLLEQIATQSVGLEILHKSKNSVVLTEVSRTKHDELQRIENRLFLALTSNLIELQTALNTRNERSGKQTLVFLDTEGDMIINRLANYASKIIYQHPENDSIYHIQIVNLLEEMGDIFKKIVHELRTGQHSKTSFVLIDRLRNSLEAAYSCFQNWEKERFIEVSGQQYAFQRAMSRDKSTAAHLGKIFVEKSMDVASISLLMRPLPPVLK